MRRFFPPPKPVNAPAVQDQKDDKAKPKEARRKKRKRKRAEKKAEKEKDNPSDHAKLHGQAEKPKPEVARPKAASCGRQGPARRAAAMGYAGVGRPRSANPYRMLVTLSSEGAAVARVELSSERYRDLEDRGGYLGHLVMDNSAKGPGCLVQVVGAGTPAAKADVRPGDRILELYYQGKTMGIDGPLGWNRLSARPSRQDH